MLTKPREKTFPSEKNGDYQAFIWSAGLSGFSTCKKKEPASIENGEMEISIDADGDADPRRCAARKIFQKTLKKYLQSVLTLMYNPSVAAWQTVKSEIAAREAGNFDGDCPVQETGRQVLHYSSRHLHVSGLPCGPIWNP